MKAFLRDALSCLVVKTEENVIYKNFLISKLDIFFIILL